MQKTNFAVRNIEVIFLLNFEFKCFCSFFNQQSFNGIHTKYLAFYSANNNDPLHEQLEKDVKDDSKCRGRSS
jgi:hypothetical protein